jgi:hypothetical protein
MIYDIYQYIGHFFSEDKRKITAKERMGKQLAKKSKKGLRISKDIR